MPRFRNEEPEQSPYSDGDVVWVKIHNTEIWWPGEVTLSQDFRFVNSNRPPFAVVAFFNEKTFEQVRSSKLIYPFQCAHKEEFIKRGTKKADGMHMGDKFSDDVAIAESRYRRHQVLEGTGSGRETWAENGIGGPAPRPDSLIKAFLSSSSSSSGSVHNSSARSSSGVPSPAGRQAPTFRIMDIGGGGTAPPPRDRAFDEAGYECNMCTFRTNSMSVLLIHRRAHLESSSSFSSNSTTSTATSSATGNYPPRKTRAARRAHTTNSTSFHRSSVRCHSRHVSIVVDAPLTNEEQKMVKSIAKQTLASIESVVRPGEDSSSTSASVFASPSASISTSTSNSSSPQVPMAQTTPRRSNAHPRDPRSQRSNQLRATMPAPESPPAKQRRLTRSMSRRQRGADSPELLLPPPMLTTSSRRGGGRRCTLAAATTASDQEVTPTTRRGNPLRKTLTTTPTSAEKRPRSAVGRRKRTFSRNRAPISDTHFSPPRLLSSPPPAKRAVGDGRKEKDKVAVLPDLTVPPSTPSPEPVSEVDIVQPPENLRHPQSSIDASKQLQLSLMAEWGDDETDESVEEPLQPQVDGDGSKVVEPPPPAAAATNQQAEEEEGEEQEKTDGVAAKKRIRNIPKKDRRDVVVQEFHVDSQPEADEPEVDEPIVIQDSDASSNGSVVFVEDEPRQRGRGLHTQPNGNGNDKATSSTKAASNIPSCFDFEEEDDLQKEPDWPDGQNGLSYRRRTNTNANRIDANGKTHCEEDVPAREEEVRTKEPVTGQEPQDNATHEGIFKGFDDVQEQTIAAVEVEAHAEPETAVEQEQEPEPLDAVAVEEAVPEEGAEGDNMSLPIKERQKRIFKSRNKSTVLAGAQEEDLLPVSLIAGDEEVSAPTIHSPLQETNCVTQLLFNGVSSRRSSAHNSNTNSSEGAMGSLSRSRKKRRNKPKTESSRRPPQRPRANIRQQTPSPSPLPSPLPAHEELSNNSSGSGSSSSSGSSNSSSHSNSNHMSSASSSSDSHGIGTLSPEPSSSNSCSIASNIAVISAEEARELQRSASGAGMIHAAIVDATQPVQRGGVLILEDIRLPNLYEPFGSLQSSDSNGSRLPDEDDEQSQDTTEHPEKNDEQEDQEEEEESHDEEPMPEDDAGTVGQPAEEEQQEKEQELEQEMDQDKKSEPQPEPEAESDLANWSPARHSPDVVRILPQAREVLLKKREQELLRQYEADLVSGRSAEKCRQARARWSRPMPSPEEEEEDAQEAEMEADTEAEVETEVDAEVEAEMEAAEPAPSPRSEEDQLELGVGEKRISSEGELPLATAEEESGEDEEQLQLEGPMDSTDLSLDEQLAAVELVLPASLFPCSRRPASHPQVTPLLPTPLATGPNKPSRHLSCARTLSDADVAKAHQQLVDLREQQRLRSSPTSPPAVLTPPETLPQAGGQRRPRRRSRNATSDHVESGSRSDVAEESSCETKDDQECPENPPQLCAGRICAVMTRPIPGYSHTFMLCSLNNNNFTPLNNVALYLDNEKNHLVPVPREALLEPPRLADGHPLSAVFADIDFLGGEAVAQVVEPSETENEADLDQEDQLSPRPHLSPQMLLSEADNDVEPVDTMGIMTPLSQVAEGSALAAGSYVNEEEELSLHDEQLQSNVLQLNVNGHRLDLDPSMLFSIAEQPDSCIEVSVTETGSGGTNVAGAGGIRAVLQARDILQAAEVYLQERDLQLVTLDDDDADGPSAGMAVPVTDLLSQALAGSQVVDDDSDFVNAANAGVGLLHIDTRTGASLLHVGNDEPGSVVFISHPMPPQTVHLTPPITARTNETNALLDQTPIMSTLENPSGMQLRRVSPLEGNLEDSLAVIGVTNGSGVPTSLELPITVTNPAIASRMGAPVTDMLQFAPFQ
ncbi:uro-adherence factor A isoform X1 [Drosophila suzukii]|uniref:Uro-adherence factor A isoform X1 n=1 Tax=Drosophila suzukii TaxID=28584 RepID=A0AB40ADG5_DROSZ